MPLNSWSSDKDSKVYLAIKELLENSAEAAEKHPRYPLIDLFLAMYTKEGVGQPKILKSSMKYSITGSSWKHAFTDKFPYSAIDLLATKGLDEVEKLWDFSRKKFIEEKYFVNAILTFITVGHIVSKFKGARNVVSYVSEGRLHPNVGSKIELYEAADSLFRELYETNSTSHPLSYDDYSKVKGVKGKSKKYFWEDYMDSLVELYNENIYAEAIAGSDWDYLEIVEIDFDEEDMEERYEQWLIYIMITTFLKESHMKTLKYEEIKAGYRVGESTINDILNTNLGSETFIEAFEGVIDYVERKEDGYVFDADDLNEIKTSKKHIEAAKDDIKNKVEKLEKIWGKLLRYISIDHHEKLKTLDEKDFVNLVEPQVAIINKKGTEFSKEEIEEMAAAAHNFLRTLFEPLAYQILSYSILTMIIKKHLKTLEEAVETCEEWLK